MNAMKKYVLPVSILLVTLVLWLLIKANPPENRRGSTVQQAQMSVEVQKIQPQNYQVMVESFGVVKPRINTVLVAQAAGQIIEVSPNFREGGFFEQGEVLLRMDDRDHQAEVKIAQSSLMNAKQQLREEQARSDQALADWKRIGSAKAPSDLVLRKPQLAAAKALVLSAEAQLQKAQLNLERATVVAPFAGRVLEQQVDVGQVIAKNSQLARIYGIDYVEVRLPIKNNDLALVNLPEEFRDQQQSQGAIEVTLASDLIGAQSWQAEVVRTEGAIDTNAQQLYVVAQIEDPYQSAHSAPIKIGQYVTAQITGKLLAGAMVIPNRAIYQGSYVYVVKDNKLIRREITTRWQNADDAIIASGLEFGEQLVLTSLGQVSSGTKVSVMAGDGGKHQGKELKDNKKPHGIDKANKQTANADSKRIAGDKS